MPRRVPPIARIRLARSVPTLLAWPVIVIGTGAMAAATWLIGSFGAGIGGVVFAVLGGVLMVAGLVMATVLLSIRLEVQEAAVRLSWLGGERIYALSRGPVTRVRLRGPEPSSLRPRFGVFGWAVGAARLRDEEDIHVVRLARTATAILVPTERGRLAIAAADERALLDALSRAARARQRLEELGEASRPATEAEPAAEAPAAAPAAEPQASAPVDVEPHVLTGIERALLEERLAEERAAAEDTARAQRRAADEAAIVAQPAPPRPAAAEEAPGPVTAAPRGRRRFALGRPGTAVAFVLLPLVGAGVAWGVGLVSGTYPRPETDAGRLTSLALVLAGPATSVGAIMARAWWPRLVGVVVGGGLAASVFIGRALLG